MNSNLSMAAGDEQQDVLRIALSQPGLIAKSEADRVDALLYIFNHRRSETHP